MKASSLHRLEDKFSVESFNATLCAMRRGEAGASRRFVDDYLPFLKNVISHLQYMVRSMDEDDLAQETLVALIASNGVCKKNAKGWLYKFAYWRIRDCNARDYALKRGGRNAAVGLDAIDMCLVDDADPARQVAAREVVEFIYSRVSDLDRRILSSIQLGFSRTETARRLGISDRTVRRRLASVRELIQGVVAA